MMTTNPATTNMTQIIKLKNNKDTYLNHTTHLLYKNRWRTSKHLARKKFNNSIPIKIPSTQTLSNCIDIINRLKLQMACCLTKQHLWMILWLLVTIIRCVESLDVTTSAYKTKGTNTSSSQFYGQILTTNSKNSNDIFRPFVPRNVLDENVFQPIVMVSKAVSVPIKSQYNGRKRIPKLLTTSSSPALEIQQTIKQKKKSMGNVKTNDAIVHQTGRNNLLQVKHHNQVKRGHKIKHKQQEEYKQHEQPSNNIDDIVKINKISKHKDLTSDLKSLQDLLVNYVTDSFEEGQYEPMPGLFVELQNNNSQPRSNNLSAQIRRVKQTAVTDAKVTFDLPRTLTTGRLLFLTGLKKVLWPVFMGLQILKSLLIAMFIPAIIGSFTKLLGKGISTGSAPLFIRPMEPPQELDFRDNSLNFDADNKFLVTDEAIKGNGPYAYNQADASQMHNEYVFDPSSTNNQMAYTPLGMNERQHQLMQDSYMSALQSIGSASFKNSGSLSTGSSGLLAPMAKRPPPAANVNTFQQFQNVPDSSLLLSNYDPFYSPLLSRLDSVFSQLKINSDKEACREKLICLMYANPAKYAPYSNLVSAQLSRELNELRKPTSDNPDILRFFKYMRAAKDGQDGLDCDKTFEKCTELKDFDNPAMVSTYLDINKLVQARKLTT